MFALHTKNLTPTALAAALALVSSTSFALEALDDTAMSDTTGEGIAYFAENLSLKMGDTDYIKMTSAAGENLPAGIKKGEFYLYGLQFGGTQGAVGATRNVTPVNIGSADNPAILSMYTSSPVPLATGGTGAVDVLSIEMPKRAEPTNPLTDVVAAENTKMALWADYLARDGAVYTDGTGADRLRVQIVQDKNSFSGTKLQLWQTPEGKLALSGLTRSNMAVDGVFRLSANYITNPAPTQVNTTDPTKARYGDAVVGTAPVFNNQEGMYWKNYDNNMPLGALGYQPVTIGSGGASGRELVLEIGRIPNDSNAYNAAYIDYSNPADVAKKTCTATSCPDTATHATLSFQLHTKNAAGAFTDTASQYYGLGRGKITTPDANFHAGSAGISPTELRELNPLPSTVASNGGTYSKFDGMFVQHLKLTTQAFD